MAEKIVCHFGHNAFFSHKKYPKTKKITGFKRFRTNDRNVSVKRKTQTTNAV